MKLTPQERTDIIFALEAMQARFEFDNVPEGEMNFNLLDDEDLMWYNDNWLEFRVALQQD